MPADLRVEALILAAGAAERLGRPKALLAFDAKTALDLVLGSVRAAGIRSGVVVVGAAAREIEAAVDPSPLRFVRNPRPEAGRMGSIRLGLRALAPESDILLWPVDRPLARPATVRALLEARAAARGAGVVVPETGGGRGHPILLRARLRRRLLEAPAGESLRRLLADPGALRHEVPVEDPGIHIDIDTPEDYERALASWRRRAGA